MTFLVIITLGLRFLLEIVTVVGLASGVFKQKALAEKLLFSLLTLGITFAWARYGAPKSPTSLSGSNKLILELVVYSIGIFGIERIFGLRVGVLYASFVVGDLLLMYLLGLQGN